MIPESTQTTRAWLPSSSFGWIDIDRDEAKRVREMLGLFKAPEAIDPHGILPLQIALSDRLFPGMSTQHTRARYVMFSAWHAQRLAQQTYKRTASEQLRIDELALMRSLLDGEDKVGVFGKRSREKTKSLPTSVYWSLLQTWGIVPSDMTIADIRSRVDGIGRRRRHIQVSDDAALSVGIDGSGIFSNEFPTSPIGFPSSDQGLKLTADEATYIEGRVAASCRGSYLHVVLTQPELAAGAYPWSTKPDAGGQDLIDAQCFSELIHPARLLYTKLLVADARKQGSDLADIDAQIDIDFAEWRDECDARIPVLQSWSANRIAQLMLESDVRLSGTRRSFIQAAVGLTASDPDGCLQNLEMERRVRSIERDVKRGTARLHGGEPFRRWMKNPTRLASKRLDYRWGNVQQFVDDLQTVK